MKDNITSVVNTIKESAKINRYKELEVVINNNKVLTRKLAELKQIQKQIVHAERLDKSSSVEKLRLKYNQKLNEIEEYPLVSEYLDLQVEINEFLQNFKDIIESGIDTDLGIN